MPLDHQRKIHGTAELVCLLHRHAAVVRTERQKLVDVGDKLVIALAK
jgi:hypothetical protein